VVEKGKIARRAGVVGLLTLLSRITGLVRDMAIAHAFGTRLAADAFFVAFRIPNLLRRLFAEGALTVSFVPVFTETFRRSREKAKELSDIAWTLMSLLLVVVSVVGISFSPLFVKLTAWGFGGQPEKFALTVTLTRVMFPYILLVSLAALAMGVLNSLKHFAVPASSSIFMNLGIIAGALGLSHWIRPPPLGLAIGVLLGGVLQLAVHFPLLGKFGFFPKFRWNLQEPGVLKIVGMMIPAAFGAAVYQFNVIVTTLLASFLPEGSVSYLWYADRIMEFPVGVWGIAMATVLLPSLSDHAAEKDYEALKGTFRYGLRMVFFLTIPAAGGLMVLAEPIVRLLLEHGHFSAVSTLHTSRALIFFAIGLPFISAVRVTSNGFYSLQDARAPVKTAVWAVVANLVLSLLLMEPIGHNGLALAISLSSTLNFLMQMALFRKKVGRLGLRAITGGILKTGLSTLGMMAVVRLLQGLYLPIHLWQQALTLFGLIAVGILTFLLFEWLLKGNEVREIGGILWKEHAR